MEEQPEPVEVRPLEAADVPAVLALVCRQEFAEGQPQGALRRVFEAAWAPDRPHSGFVLRSAGRIVGCFGLIFSARVVDGRRVRFANATTWFVEPPFRRHARRLLAACQAIDDCTLTALSASPHVSDVIEAAGFEVVSRRRLFYGPPLWPLDWVRRRVLDDPHAIAGLLDEEHRRILEDHLPYGLGHFLVREGERYAYVVAKRRWEKGWFLPRLAPRTLRLRSYPVSDLFFVSDPSLAIRQWGHLQSHMMIRQRTVGVAVEESFLGGLAPKARSTPHHVHAYHRNCSLRSIDALYSELVFLS